MTIKHFHQLSQRAQAQLKSTPYVQVSEKIDGVPVELSYIDGAWKLSCPYYTDERKAAEAFNVVEWPKQTAQILSARTALRDIGFTMVAAMVDTQHLDPTKCSKYVFETLPFTKTNAIEYHPDRIGCHFLEGNYDSLCRALKQRFDIAVIGLGSDIDDVYRIRGVFHRVDKRSIPGKDLDVFNTLVASRKDMEGVVVEGAGITAKITTYHFKHERERVWNWINKIQDTSFNRNKVDLWTQFKNRKISQRQFVDGMKMYLSIHKMETPFDVIQHKIVEDLLEQYS